MWPQQTWAESWWALPPFWGGGASPSNNVAGAEVYLHAKFHLDPSNRLATVYQRHRWTGQADRQRSDSIGRTVLQTVAQKLTDFNHLWYVKSCR